MNNRQQIDSWVASYMCDVVESFTHLEEIIRDLRWRMLRGEPREMQMMMLNARKHARDLKTRMDGLDHTLESSGYQRADDGGVMQTYVTEELKSAGLKVVATEKTNG
jgi:hypothetical protein